MKVSIAKISIGVAFAISVAVAVNFAIAWYDVNVSLMFSRKSNDYMTKTNKTLRSLLLVTAAGMSRQQLLKVANSQVGHDEISKTEGDDLLVGDTVFKYRGDKLTDVVPLSPAESESKLPRKTTDK